MNATTDILFRCINIKGQNIYSTPWFRSFIWIAGSDVTLYVLIAPFFCLEWAVTVRVRLNGSSLHVSLQWTATDTVNDKHTARYRQLSTACWQAENWPTRRITAARTCRKATPRRGRESPWSRGRDLPFPSPKLATLAPRLIFRKERVKKRCNNTPSTRLWSSHHVCQEPRRALAPHQNTCETASSLL